MKYNTNTPILFLVFNRLSTTAKVFTQISKIKPRKLYVAADGPRNPEEKDICEQVRKIATSVDWECEIFTLFRDNNLGYGQANIEAINWFYNNEPEGIILEDDCLPNDSFFGFCSYMLEKYRNDNRIGHIGGSNFQKGLVRGDSSYYFSAQTPFWGWASWRRIWKDYDMKVNPYYLFEKMKRHEFIPSIAHHIDFWYYKFRIEESAKSWGFQYFYLNLINNRLSIVPNTNLITNIGCYDNPTHLIKDHPFADMPIAELDTIVHPSLFLADIEADIHAIHTELKVTPSEFYGKEFSFIKNKLLSINPEKDSYMKIPKIIHQIYYDPAGVPEDLVILSQTWKDKHPTWEYRFWNKIAVEQFIDSHFQDLFPLYHSFPFDVQRWDFVRYLILYHFGGLYVDFDYECIEPLDCLLWNSSCCMGLEAVQHAVYQNKSLLLGNALMATVPKHNFFDCIIKNISDKVGEQLYTYKAGLVLETTGPFMINRVYDAYERKDEITLLPAELVAPLSLEENHKLFADGIITKNMGEKIENAFAIHYFFNTWVSQIEEQL